MYEGTAAHESWRGCPGLFRRVWAPVCFAAQISPKTLRFNFHYFSWRTAIHLPVLLHRRTCLRALRGTVEIVGPVHRGMLTLGFPSTGNFDEKRSRLVWENFGAVTFGGPGSLGAGCALSIGPKARLHIGAGVAVNSELTLICRHEIILGKDCMMGWKVLVMDSDMHQILSADGRLLNPNKPIHVGDRVWIASKSIVMKGSVLPDDTIVAAGSTVAGEVAEPGQVVGGSPARVLTSGVRWLMKPPPCV